MCQENSYPGPPRHFPSARGWSLNICYSSAHERLTSTLVCMFSHPISKGNALIGWRSYLQDAIVHAASRYLASEAGDDVLGITPALCNQPRAAISASLSRSAQRRRAAASSQLELAEPSGSGGRISSPLSRQSCEKTCTRRVFFLSS